MEEQRADRYHGTYTIPLGRHGRHATSALPTLITASASKARQLLHHFNPASRSLFPQPKHHHPPGSGLQSKLKPPPPRPSLSGRADTSTEARAKMDKVAVGRVRRGKSISRPGFAHLPHLCNLARSTNVAQLTVASQPSVTLVVLSVCPLACALSPHHHKQPLSQPACFSPLPPPCSASPSICSISIV